VSEFEATLKTDDFAGLCELVRRQCGVDLLQYKRGQMERRVRTFAQRRGTPDLLAYGRRLKADAEELDASMGAYGASVEDAVALWREFEGEDFGETEPLLRAAFIDYLLKH